MKTENALAVTLLLLAAVQLPCFKATTSIRKWWPSRESLRDYEAVKSRVALTELDCLAAASRDSAVQLVAFNTSSGLCTHFRCRLGLRHCRKCRNLNKGAQRVWTAKTASNSCWTTVQHRVSGSVDFNRNWSQYQSEFGEGPDGNYWIGLNNLHALTSSGARKLRFLLKTWNDSESWAEYSSFSVGLESENYRLSVSGFSGSDGIIGDCLARNNSMQFSTFDADHDSASRNCASISFGAWWFSDCSDSFPNGQYREFPEAINVNFADGIIWRYPYGSYYSLKEIEMLIL